MMPNNNVLRSATVNCQNTSCPRDVVPSQKSALGGMSGATT